MAARAYCVGTTCPSDVPDSVAVRAVPLPPDYDDATMWYVQEDDRDGMGADVFYVVSTWEFDWTTAAAARVTMPTCGIPSTAPV